MGIETRTKEIGGVKYELTLLGAKQADAVLIRLSKIALPALGEIMKYRSDGLEKGLDAAIKQLGQSLNEEDYNYIVDVFANKTTYTIEFKTNSGVTERKISLAKDYDNHFSRRMKDSKIWLIWCIKENYEDFLDVGVLEELKGGVPKASSLNSPKE